MMDFSILKTLTIPEGDVKRIDIDGVKKWEVNVLDLYQRVEYIKTEGGTSGGWFLTDFIANNQSGMELTFSCPKFADQVHMGSRASATNSRFYIWYPMAATRGYHGWNTAVAQSVSTTSGTKYTSRLNWLNERKSVLLDADETVRSTKAISGTLVQQVVPVSICRYNNVTNTPGGGRPMSLYGARFSQGSEIVREYLPCYRKSDGEIGLLEMLTGQFVPSQVSDGFTKGPDVEWDAA